jgi:hypothetical protein
MWWVMEIYELTFSVSKVYIIIKARTVADVECCIPMLVGGLWKSRACSHKEVIL